MKWGKINITYQAGRNNTMVIGLLIIISQYIFYVSLKTLLLALKFFISCNLRYITEKGIKEKKNL
jgi:hypothetical protein